MRSLLLSMLLFSCFYSLAQNAPMNVKVTDFQNNVLKGEQVLFIEQSTKKEYKGISDSNGDIKFSLPAGKYDIKLKSVGEAEDFSTFEVPKLGPNQAYQPASMQIQIQEAKSFTLDNLHFATGKWSIMKSSYKELNELADYMKFKKDIKIEIGGHTDSDGDDAANLTLSQKRADEVRKYLISKGISADRIKAVGHGESKPIADNDTANGKAQNRRTEIRIL